MYYYIGTVTLKMSPRLFWHTTPRKFSALCQVHIDVNSIEKKENTKNGAVGKPDAYVDELSFM